MRLRFCLFVFTLAFLAVIAKLAVIQIVNHDRYLTLAENQRTLAREIPAQRGKIYASGGVLATSEDAFRLVVDPSMIKDHKKLVKKIAPLLLSDSRFLAYNPLPKEKGKSKKEILTEKLENLLDDKERRWASLARKVPREIREKIEALGFEYLAFEDDPRRFYPEGKLAANVLGMVASDRSGLDRGYFGLEGYYNGDLKGTPGKLAQEYSALGEPILVAGYKLLEPQDGSDLYLTIDRNIQSILERKIEEGVKRYGAKRGCFVVLEPKSGKVLAMGNYPTFDPAEFNSSSKNKGGKKAEIRNLATAITYEPGSVMKAVTMSAAIDTGTVKPNSTFNDDGPVKIGGYWLNTWDGRHHGKQTMIELLQKSNNVGAVKVGLKLGKDKLRSYFSKFGFGKSLGIDLEGEEAGKVKSKWEWKEVDTATASFGQGIAVTPLQMANAFATIANGGMLMKPYVVEKIVTQSGKEINFEPEPIGRAIKPESAETVAKMLLEAAEGGEARNLLSHQYRIAGKTGTATIPVKGRYEGNQTNVTFVGFLSKEKPFVMLIMLERPTTSIFSASTVVPLWVETADEIAPLFGVQPDK